jgi:hypothetical protein
MAVSVTPLTMLDNTVTVRAHRRRRAAVCTRCVCLAGVGNGTHGAGGGQGADGLGPGLEGRALHMQKTHIAHTNGAHVRLQWKAI